MPIAPEHLHLAYQGPFYAYLYGRASRDPKKKGRSVSSQLTEGRAVCTANEWPIIREFRDVDRSASRYAKKTRDDWEEMLEGIEQGVPRILVAFEASRYYRDLDAYVRLRSACMASGVLLCYDGAVYDLSKRADRKATAMDAVNAEDEADGIQIRNMRTVRQNAQKGGPHGRILWGYMRKYDPETGDLIGQFPHPDRADVPADIFNRFISGETVYSIHQNLRATRDPVEDEREWEYFHVYEMLRNPSYAGLRVYQGKVLGKAQWDGLVKKETFDAAQRILDDPERAASKDWSVAHLLPGIGRCYNCPPDGDNPPPPLRTIGSDGEPTYICKARSDVSMRTTKLDAYVEEAVIEWLASKAAVAAFDPTAGQERLGKAQARYKSLTAQLQDARDLAAQFNENNTPKLSVASLASIEARLQPLIDKAKAEMEDVPAVPPQLRRFVGKPRASVESSWEDLSLEQRRAVVRNVVNVGLRKSARRGRAASQIDPGRVVLTFRGEAGFVSEWRRGPVSAPSPAGELPE